VTHGQRLYLVCPRAGDTRAAPRICTGSVYLHHAVVALVPLEFYLSLNPDCAEETRGCVEDQARARWLRQALSSGLEPAWPSVLAEVTPWGVLVRGLLWRPALHVESAPAPPS